ncbi:MAG: hypothetical protein J0I41_20350 [Filimonas sp.]|nr:hypothetical protein [Filimonas sp.]
MPTNDLLIEPNRLVSPEYGQPNTIPDDNPPQDYRYTFNGKESDNDVKGVGNQQDYGFRIYDPRTGRFYSVDPIARSYPELSTYRFASNRPIYGIDQDGKEWELSTIKSQLENKIRLQNALTVQQAQSANARHTIAPYKPSIGEKMHNYYQPSSDMEAFRHMMNDPAILSTGLLWYNK